MTKVIRESNPKADQAVAPARKPGSRLIRWIAMIIVGGGIALFFLPSLAERLCQSPGALAWVSGQPEGTIEVGQALFSWQGPVQLKNVIVQTPDGHPIANISSLTSDRTLWNLLTQRTEKLSLKLDGARFTVTVTDPGPPQGRLDLAELTNAVQTFKIPCPSSLPIEVTITNGTIDFQNERYEPVDQWANITATYRYDTATQQMQSLSATLPAAAERGTGEVTLQGQWTREQNAEQTETITIESRGDRLSLAAADPWLRKYLGPEHGLTSCSGTWQAFFRRSRETGWELSTAARLNEPSAAPISNQQVAFDEPSPPQATLELQSQFSKQADQLLIPRLHLAADQAAIDLQGSVKDISDQQILDVLAEVKTPGNALMDLLPLEMREQIQVEGVRFSQIAIQGSLLPAADGTAQPLAYSLVASWDKALAYGLESQNGQLKVSYRDGQVQAEPVNVPVSGGALRMLPTLDLRTQPATLHFQSGMMLENVKLTEAVCRDWLMYISPTLANATSADGKFSLAMNEGQMVLGQTEKADLSGTLLIRDAAVRPGPLAVEMLQQVAHVQQMLNRGGADLTQKAFLTMKQEDVPFRLHEGRVYHENFGANVGEMRISTAGSMGLDHTLGMQLRIAFPEKWLAADRPVLQALAGQPIVLGIGGTLDRPKIDGSAMADFGKQIGIKAGVGLLEKLIERRQQRNR